MITCSIKLAIVQRYRSQKERQSAYRKPATQGGLQATLTLEAQPHISRIGAFVFALMARPRAAGSDFAV
jgi:hypothetical protein